MPHFNIARFRTGLIAASSVSMFAITPVCAHAQDALPDAKTILNDYRKAIGGAAAFDKLQSIHETGTFEMAAAGIKGAVEAYSARPNKAYVEVTIDGLGQVLNGSDGKVAWSVNPMCRPSVLSGTELTLALEDADFADVFKNPDSYTSVTTLEKSTMDGQSCYKVKIVKKSGAVATDCYATDTHLLVGTVATLPVAGAAESTTLFKDYKPVDGVMIPSRILLQSAGAEQSITFTKVETNNVADSKFDLPAAIKALIKS
jgi:hypothetical protein